jgi:hypothetical protein
MNYPVDGQEEAMRKLGASPKLHAQAYLSNVTPQPISVRFEYGGEREKVELDFPAPELRARRSAACGKVCLARACEFDTINKAEIFAESKEPAPTSTRIWLTNLLWQIMTNNRVGEAPQNVREYFANRSARQTECDITSVIDMLIRDERGAAFAHERIRRNPEVMTQFMASVAHELLRENGDIRAGDRLGPTYVPPPIQWCIEMEKVDPYQHERKLGDDRIAPDLDFELPGVPSSGTVAERREALLNQCPWSMKHRINRDLTEALILGNDELFARYTDDMASLHIGDSWEERHNKVAAATGVGQPLQTTPDPIHVTLNWLKRFVYAYAKTENTPAPPQKNA